MHPAYTGAAAWPQPPQPQQPQQQPYYAPQQPYYDPQQQVQMQQAQAQAQHMAAPQQAGGAAGMHPSMMYYVGDASQAAAMGYGSVHGTPMALHAGAAGPPLPAEAPEAAPPLPPPDEHAAAMVWWQQQQQQQQQQQYMQAPQAWEQAAGPAAQWEGAGMAPNHPMMQQLIQQRQQQEYLAQQQELLEQAAAAEAQKAQEELQRQQYMAFMQQQQMLQQQQQQMQQRQQQFTQQQQLRQHMQQQQQRQQQQRPQVHRPKWAAGEPGPTPQAHLQQASGEAEAVAQTQGQPAAPKAALADGAVAAAKQRIEALRTVVDVQTLLRAPGRAARPARILIVLRGLPGSGKSFLAKKLRDAEVEEGGEAPRLHALDDYFVAEVEKEVDDPAAKGKGRKRTVTEMEYQYDPDMEAVYQRSLCKALGRTLEEGRFTFVLMDAPNIKLDEFRDVLAAAQKSGYEPYVLQPLETDPVLCAQRNVHGRTLEQLRELAAAWDAPPPMLPLLDVQRFMHGKLAGASHIEEVVMESDEEAAGAKQGGSGRQAEAAGAAQGVRSSNGAASRPSGACAADHAAEQQPAAEEEDAAPALRSRWLVQDGEGEEEEEGGGGGVAGLPRPAKRLHTLGVSDADILHDLNTALASEAAPQAASSSGRAGEGGRAAGVPKPLKSALRGGVGEGQLGPSLKPSRKRVRWPDDEGGAAGREEQHAQEGAGPPKQLAEVHYVEGLGPQDGETALIYMDHTSPFLSPRRTSFADQVKAEHCAEHAAHDALIHGMPASP